MPATSDGKVGKLEDPHSLQVYGKDRKICAGLQAAVSASWVESIAAEVAAADDAGRSAADPPV